MASSVNAENGLKTQVYEFAIESGQGQSVTGLTLGGTIEVLQPEPDLEDGEGFVSAITPIQEDISDGGKLYVSGFSDPDYGQYRDFERIVQLFTIATLAAFPPVTTGPITAARILCLDMTLPPASGVCGYSGAVSRSGC